ncbi:MAG: hypothetical protein Q9184_001757 [Pyrenodesmia sp. 2 TL-2023]
MGKPDAPKADPDSHKTSSECDPVGHPVTIKSLRTYPVPVVDIGMAVIYTTVEEVENISKYDRRKNTRAGYTPKRNPYATEVGGYKPQEMWIGDLAPTQLANAEDTRRHKEAPEAACVKLLDDKIGANATAKPANAAQNRQKHDMPHLPLLDKYQGSAVVVIIPERPRLTTISFTSVRNKGKFTSFPMLLVSVSRVQFSPGN